MQSEYDNPNVRERRPLIAIYDEVCEYPEPAEEPDRLPLVGVLLCLFAFMASLVSAALALFYIFS